MISLSRNKWRFGVLMVMGISVLAIGAQGAEPTAADTTISNQASVDYDVGGVDQDDIPSSPTGNSDPAGGANTDFVVDAIVDVLVSGGNTENVAPGQANQGVQFTVKNEGNQTQDFLLSWEALTGTNDFAMTGLEIYLEDGTAVGFDADDDLLPVDGLTTQFYIDELAAGGEVTLFLVGDTPAVAAGGESSQYYLLAIAHDAAGSTGALGVETHDDFGSPDSAATVEVVFRDQDGPATVDDEDDDPTDEPAANDTCEHSAIGTFGVLTAELTVQKEATVIWDPISGITDPKAIPGAIIEYTITVSNGAGAGAAATNVVITDSLDPEITAGTVEFVADAYGAGQGIKLDDVGQTNADDDPGTDYSQFVGNIITVGNITLNTGESAVVKFQVKVQ